VAAVSHIVGQVRAALEHEPRINLHRFPLSIELGDDGTLVLEGEAENIAAKKLVLELAASIAGVAGIVDRVRVVPGQRMGDGQIRDHVRNALIGEPAFENCTVLVQLDKQWVTARTPISQSHTSLWRAHLPGGWQAAAT
jgi:hypothetical protein